VVAAVPSGGEKQVLVVNGFDRLDRPLDPKQPGQSPAVDRVRPRQSNSRDYVAQVALAINQVDAGIHVDSTSNEPVIAGTIDLTDYDTVIWILGEESSDDDTFNATEQIKVEQFIAGGGNLFLSGAEIGWDLDNLNNGRAFYEGTLLANYVLDDANTYQANGIAGRIFAGLSLTFDNGSLFYDVTFPDVINPQPSALAALTYANGAGNAAIQAAGTGGRGSIVMLGFPFETITTAANRAAVIDRVFDFFGLEAIPLANADFNDDGIVDAADFTVWRDTLGRSVTPGEFGDADFNGQVEAADYTIWKEQFGTSPGAGAAAAAAVATEPSTAAASPAFELAVAAEADAARAPAAPPGGLSWLADRFARGGTVVGSPRLFNGRLVAATGEVAQLRTAEKLLLASAGRQRDLVARPIEPRGEAAGDDADSDTGELGAASRAHRLVKNSLVNNVNNDLDGIVRTAK
jgi:hypothetical protein